MESDLLINNMHTYIFDVFFFFPFSAHREAELLPSLLVGELQDAVRCK